MALLKKTTDLLKQYYIDRIDEAIQEDKEAGGNCNITYLNSIILDKVKSLNIPVSTGICCEDKEGIGKLIDENKEFAIDVIKLRIIVDYVSGMTDRMAEKKYNEICSSSTQWSKAYSERSTFEI